MAAKKRAIGALGVVAGLGLVAFAWLELGLGSCGLPDPGGDPDPGEVGGEVGGEANGGVETTPDAGTSGNGETSSHGTTSGSTETSGATEAETETETNTGPQSESEVSTAAETEDSSSETEDELVFPVELVEPPAPIEVEKPESEAPGKPDIAPEGTPEGH